MTTPRLPPLFGFPFEERETPTEKWIHAISENAKLALHTLKMVQPRALVPAGQQNLKLAIAALERVLLDAEEADRAITNLPV